MWTYQQVLWFDISVDDVHPVQILDRSSQVEHHGTGVTLAVLSGGGDGVKQVTALKEAEVEKEKKKKHSVDFKCFRILGLTVEGENDEAP